MKFWTMVVLIGFGKKCGRLEGLQNTIKDFYKACPLYTVTMGDLSLTTPSTGDKYFVSILT